MFGRFAVALRAADLRRLIFASSLSQLGDRLTHMLLISVIALTRPGRLLGYSEGALAFALPTLILAPLAGVLVDRWDKRRVLAFVHFAQSAILLATPLLIGLTGSFVPFWVSVFLFFGLDVFNNTATPALLPSLVPGTELLLANSVSLTFARIATVIGMLAGGFLVRWVGWGVGLGIDSATHLAAGLLALTISFRPTPVTSPPLGGALRAAASRFFGNLTEVLALVKQDRIVAFVLASVAVSTFVSAVSYTVLIFLVQQVLGLGTSGVGILAGVLAVGMILGAASMSAARADINRPLVVVGTVFLYGLLFLAAWWHISLPFILAVAVVAGTSFSWLGIVQNTMLQEETSAAVRGRIFSVREFVTNATFILTTLLVGALGDLTSYRTLLPIVGLSLMAAAVLGFRLVRPGRPRLEGPRCR